MIAELRSRNGCRPFASVDSLRSDGWRYLIGNIEFSVEDMPGNCGVFILAHFEVLDNGVYITGEDFAKALRHYLQEDKGIVLASDVVGGEVHTLLDVHPWQKGQVAYNPRSGNRIQVFELKIEENE